MGALLESFRKLIFIDGLFLDFMVVMIAAGTAFWLSRKYNSRVKKQQKAKANFSKEKSIKDASFVAAVKRVLTAKNRRNTPNQNAGTLLKILEAGAQVPSVQKQVTAKPALPPVPRLGFTEKYTEKYTEKSPETVSRHATRDTSALEKIVVQMFEEYLKGISEFQQKIASASTESEIIHKTCHAFSRLTHQGRVVYLEYQNAQRAVMVTARSDTKIFAGTQPRMFLPLRADLATNRARVEDLRNCFEKLPQDRELQRLLQDACLLEAPTDGEVSQDLLWSSRTPWMIVPLILRGIPQGFFAIQKHAVCDRKEFKDVANIYLTGTSTTIENLRLHSRMGEVNSRDNVTGLLSRKVFNERMEECFLIAGRLKHPVTLLRLDVQHMDAFTKRYGVHVRDAILRHVSRHLKRFFRQSDVLARFTTDGFAVIMPHTALMDALKKSEEFIVALSDSKLKIGSGEAEFELKIDACAGLAEYPSHADSASDLIRFATEAVFRGMNKDKKAVTMAKVPMGYVPPFNSRFIRSSPKAFAEAGASRILDS